MGVFFRKKVAKALLFEMFLLSLLKLIYLFLNIYIFAFLKNE